MMRHRKSLLLASVLGIALFAWTVYSVGPRELVNQCLSLAHVLPLILTLAAVRFACQAGGWWLAMPAGPKPPIAEAFAAVVSGEAAGYFAWGAATREPLKAMLVGHRMPQRDALGSAVAERSVYSGVAAALILAAIGIVADRFDHLAWLAIASVAIVAVAWVAKRYGQRLVGDLPRRPAALCGVALLAAAQEISNLVEAYLVLQWLGASPTMGSVVVLEGIGRLLNGAGQFIPGKLGVTEAATGALAGGLQLGSAHGVSLALARRARSLAWGALGIAFVMLRAVRRRDQVQEGSRPALAAAAY